MEKRGKNAKERIQRNEDIITVVLFFILIFMLIFSDINNTSSNQSSNNEENFYLEEEEFFIDEENFYKFEKEYFIDEATTQDVLTRDPGVGYKTGPIFIRMFEIKRELRLTQLEIEKTVTSKGTTNFLFTAPDSRLMESAIPALLENNIPGVFALSEDGFPGKEGMLSLDEVNELCSKGWSLALDGRDVSRLEELYRKTLEAGLPAPQAIYSPTGSSGRVLPYAEKLGIHCVITYGTLHSVKDMEDILYIDCIGLMHENRSVYWRRARMNGETLFFTVGYVRNGELYSENELLYDIGVFQKYIDEGKMQILSTEDTYQYYLGIKKEMENGNEQLFNRVNELKEAITALRNELRSIVSQTDEETTVGLGSN